jgi:hypothetical protein
VAARVAGLGGDPGAIARSPDGAPQPSREKPSRTTTGRVLEVRYDCAGHISAFVVGGCCEHAEFRASEPGLSRIRPYYGRPCRYVVGGGRAEDVARDDGHLAEAGLSWRPRWG